jgi:hydroxymethylpyrimidine/phosphomethylpyrimidine kinase
VPAFRPTSRRLQPLASVYGATVITALTAQNTREVTVIEPVRAAPAQIDAVFADLQVDAVKIGMLGQATIIEAVAAGLDRHRQKTVVLDPVLVASASATVLLAPDAIEQLRDLLIPRDPQPTGGRRAAWRSAR